MIEHRISHSCEGMDWNALTELIRTAGLACQTPQIYQKVFHNSYAVVFLWEKEKLIGCGRALSDGAVQTAIYDIALLPEYQGFGLGRTIVEELIRQTPGCNFILYAAPGKESFYQKLGFSRLKTGMGLFVNPDNLRNRGMLE